MAADRHGCHATGHRRGRAGRRAAIIRFGARLVIPPSVPRPLGGLLRVAGVHPVLRPFLRSAVYLLSILSILSMLQFLLKLALLLPLLIGMAWVNWSIDPAILFVEHQDDRSRHAYETTVAEDLLAKRPHRLKTTYLELLVDELIFRNRPQIDTLVLGTSIAKPIHEGLFGGPNFFNASVNGGRIEEMLVAYQLALDCGLHPRHVLIEIDGRSLGQRVGQPPSNTLRKAFKRLGIPNEAKRDPILPMIWRALIPGDDVQGAAKEHGAFYPYDEIISPRYFQFTMAYVVRRWMPTATSLASSSRSS